LRPPASNRVRFTAKIRNQRFRFEGDHQAQRAGFMV
jgi:hypothetical protein